MAEEASTGAAGAPPGHWEFLFRRDAMPDAPVNPRSQGGTETIMLVEDDDTVRTLAERVLRREGYRVMCAANGEDGLRLSAGHRGPIHLVVTDVAMPVMGGLALTRELQRQRPDVRILYITGYTEGEVQRDRLGSAESALLEKPFTPKDLCAAIRRVLNDWAGPGLRRHSPTLRRLPAPPRPAPTPPSAARRVT